MTSITDVLVVRGILPPEAIDGVGADEDDFETIRDYVARGVVTPIQVAMARAAQLGLPFVELAEVPG